MKKERHVYDIMSMAHGVARRMRAIGDKRKYKELLSLALKVEHRKARLITIADINWLKEFYPEVDLTMVTTLYASDRFIITGGYYLTIQHYVRPRTEEEDNYCIGVMIESETKSARKLKLD